MFPERLDLEALAKRASVIPYESVESIFDMGISKWNAYWTNLYRARQGRFNSYQVVKPESLINEIYF